MIWDLLYEALVYSDTLRLSTVQCVLECYLVWIFWKKIFTAKRAAGTGRDTFSFFFFFFSLNIGVSGLMPGTAIVILLP